VIVTALATACSLLPDNAKPLVGLPTTPPLPGLQFDRISISPVTDNRVTVVGSTGTAINGTVAVLFWCEPTPEPGKYMTQHRAATIVEASASIDSDGGFAATVLESQVPGERIRQGYTLEIVALGRNGQFGHFYSKALQ
jgi:hypothetical protein